MSYDKYDPRVARLTRRMIEAGEEERRRRFVEESAADGSLLSSFSEQEIADMKLLVATYEARQRVETQAAADRAALYLSDQDIDEASGFKECSAYFTEPDPRISVMIQNSTLIAIVIGLLCLLASAIYTFVKGI